MNSYLISISFIRYNLIAVEFTFEFYLHKCKMGGIDSVVTSFEN